MSLLNLISLLGMPALIFLAWIMSNNRRIFNWRVVIWGTGLQLIFAGFIFAVPFGAKLFMFLNDVVLFVMSAATEGAKFLFGPLALSPGATEKGASSIGFILAFQGLPTVVFFAALLGMLYFIGLMPFLIRLFAKIFTRWMKLSGAEALCVSSNIFVGVESALTVRPYIERMTKSELCTILSAMMGTIASSVLGLYVMFLQPVFSNIAGHLLSASILSAPASALMAKVIYPETDKPETLGVQVEIHYQRESNAMEAIINGAMAGAKMLFGIGAMLLAFLGLVALADKIFALGGNYINQWTGWGMDFSLKGLFGYLFYPLTILMGVNPTDALEISKIIGERTIVTELTAYLDLSALIASGKLLDPRSAVLASYALCGFAHFASLGIFIGGVSAIAPSRIKDLSVIGFRALIAATLACLMTGCVAGVFLTQGSILLR